MSDVVEKFLASNRPMLIGGEWVQADSGELIEVIDPATEKVLATVSAASKSEVDAAVTSASEAFRNGTWTEITAYDRSKMLWRIAELLEENIQELALLNTLENGKPLSAGLAGDVPAAAKTFRHYAGLCTKIEGKTPQVSSSPNDFHAYTRREPIGVVGQIVPWNGPIVAASWKLAPALAAGCTTVFKPAEETPLTALFMGQLLQEAGIPAGVVNIIPGYGHIAGAAMCEHDQIRKIAFTGSTEVGQQIIRQSAGNLKKISLELGGKSPVIICADADLDRAIPAAANAIFFNAGQVCIAGSRLYIEDAVYDQVLEGLVQIADNMCVGSGMNADTQMGPLISRKQLDRVLSMVEHGHDQGARVVSGGNRLEQSGYFMRPTILADVDHDMTVVREEIFGPVLCAMRFDDIDEVMERANDTNYGLAASIWTQNLARGHRLAAQVQAGLVWINCHAAADPAIPFGGYKQSGWGRENGWEAMEQYMELKSVVASLQ